MTRVNLKVCSIFLSVSDGNGFQHWFKQNPLNVMSVTVLNVVLWLTRNFSSESRERLKMLNLSLSSKKASTSIKICFKILMLAELSV